MWLFDVTTYRKSKFEFFVTLNHWIAMIVWCKRFDSVINIEFIAFFQLQFGIGSLVKLLVTVHQQFSKLAIWCCQCALLLKMCSFTFCSYSLQQWIVLQAHLRTVFDLMLPDLMSSSNNRRWTNFRWIWISQN